MTTISADATPEKRFFLEIFARDLSLEDCILDLIDNSIDSLVNSRGIDVSDALLPIQGENPNSPPIENKSEPAVIDIKYDLGHFQIVDNCGGITVEAAKDGVFHFGPSPGAPKGQLGVYGIGLKRAIFKIGNQILIESRTHKDGFRVKIDVPTWANDRSNWKLPMEIIDSAPIETPEGTLILVKQFKEEVLERFKSGTFEKRLYDLIARTYCLFLNRYVLIKLNNTKIEPIQIPLGSSEHINVAKDEFSQDDVKVTLYAGLAARSSEDTWRAEDAGWYTACNGRLVVVADTSELTGWGPGPGAVSFHPKYRGFVGVAFFYSKNPFSLPWTTTKRGLNRESLIYLEARGRMIIVAKPILRFLENMYSSEDIEKEGQRRIAQEVKPIDVRELTGSPTVAFEPPKVIPPEEATTRVQYNAKNRDLDRVRKCLRKSRWGAAQIGRHTFEHFLKTECPE